MNIAIQYIICIYAQDYTPLPLVDLSLNGGLSRLSLCRVVHFYLLQHSHLMPISNNVLSLVLRRVNCFDITIIMLVNSFLFIYLPRKCGRSLSMVHDAQGNSCPDEGAVMAASLGKGLQLYEWSNCSASELRSFRISGGTECLMETDPANDTIKPSCFDQQFDLTYQCKAMFGDHAIVCPYANSVSSSCFVHSVYTYVYAQMCMTASAYRL